MRSGATASRPRRRTTSIRPCTLRGVRWTAARSRCGMRCSSSERTSMSTGWSSPLPRHAAPGHRRRTVRRSPSMAASCCQRTATTTGRAGRREELARTGRRTRGRTRGLLADADRPPSLPADASSFVGRSRELAELGSLLRDTSLLSLAGPAVWARPGSPSSWPVRSSRPTRMVRLWSSSPTVTDAAAGRGRGCGRARRAGAVRADAHRRRRRVRHAALAPARARQLRAPASSDGRACGHTASLRAAAHDPRDEPRAAACARRGRVPGSVARHP